MGLDCTLFMFDEHDRIMKVQLDPEEVFKKANQSPKKKKAKMKKSIKLSTIATKRV